MRLRCGRGDGIRLGRCCLIDLRVGSRRSLGWCDRGRIGFRLARLRRLRPDVAVGSRRLGLGSDRSAIRSARREKWTSSDLARPSSLSCEARRARQHNWWRPPSSSCRSGQVPRLLAARSDDRSDRWRFAGCTRGPRHASRRSQKKREGALLRPRLRNGTGRHERDRSF